MTTLLGAVVGIGVATGLLLIYTGWRAPQALSAPRRATRPATTSALVRMCRLRSPLERILATVSLAAGVLMAVFQGWLIAVVALPVIAVGLPRVLTPPSEIDIDRLEAMEDWTRSLSGIVQHSGLATAITATLPSAPVALERELTTLVARIQAGQPLKDALYGLAEDLDDQTGDYIVAALIQAADARNAGLRECLDAIATDVAREVRNRREIRTEQTAVFTNVQMIVGLIVAMTAGVVMFTSFGAFYRTAPGQIILAVLIAAFAGCLMLLRARAAFTPPPRFLLRPTSEVTP